MPQYPPATASIKMPSPRAAVQPQISPSLAPCGRGTITKQDPRYKEICDKVRKMAEIAKNDIQFNGISSAKNGVNQAIALLAQLAE